jgi:VanZ family protein
MRSLVEPSKGIGDGRTSRIKHCPVPEYAVPRLTAIPLPKSSLTGFITLYVLFLAIGSLYPFTGWAPLSSWSTNFLTAPWPRYITRTDLATNMLVYVPLGYALARWHAHPGHGARGVTAGALTGLALSLLLESGQELLPGRIASNLDMLVNGLGALTGALLSLHHGRWLRALRALHRWRGRWFLPGGSANFGLGLLLLLFLAQFALLPFPGLGWLDLHLRPIDTPPGGLDQINLPWFSAVFLEIATLGAFAANLLRPGRYVSAMLLLVVLAFMMKLLAATILLKLKVVGGVLSLETLAAFLLAFWLLLNPQVSRHRMRVALILLLATLLFRFGLTENHWWPAVSVLNIVGLAKLVATLWPVLALILLAASRPGGTGRG